MSEWNFHWQMKKKKKKTRFRKTDFNLYTYSILWALSCESHCIWLRQFRIVAGKYINGTLISCTVENWKANTLSLINWSLKFVSCFPNKFHATVFDLYSDYFMEKFILLDFDMHIYFGNGIKKTSKFFFLIHLKIYCKIP